MKYIIFSCRITLHTLRVNPSYYLLYGVDPKLAPYVDWRFIGDHDEKNRIQFLSLQRMEVQLRT